MAAKVKVADNWMEKPPPTKRPRGSAHHAARLTETHVKQIRKAYGDGEGEWTIAQLADKFKMSWRQVWAIVTRRSWKHVE